MNVKEGMRRLALLVGVLGATLGCFASYVVLRDALAARARHKAFELLATSDVVQELRKMATVDYGAFVKKYRWQVDYDALAKKYGGQPVPPKGGKQQIDFSKYDPEPWEPDATPISFGVNKGGIKTIHWTKDLGVESIETEDGATLYPTPAPTRWRYLLAAIFPLLGFAVPWGSVRALAWVGVGFLERSK
jgi:hypothetical protein